MSLHSPLGDAFLQPGRFLQHADRVLRAGGDPAAFAVVERGLEVSFEAALRTELGPVVGAATAPAHLAHGAQGPVALAQQPEASPLAWALPAPPAPPRAVAAPQGAPPAAGGVSRWEGAISEVASRHGVPAWLVSNVVRQESGGNPQATSPAGAMGLMQLMPGTAAELGVAAPYDPLQNLEGGVRYLAKMIELFNGDLTRAVAAYNAGPGAVQRHGGVPPYAETQGYVKRVLGEGANGNG